MMTSYGCCRPIGSKSRPASSGTPRAAKNPSLDVTTRSEGGSVADVPWSASLHTGVYVPPSPNIGILELTPAAVTPGS